VQGEGAAEEIARAISVLSRNHEQLGVDAVILTRGGGSKEDLWAFNDRALAEAIVRCAVPVVAAIGHETDTTTAELVADVRAATPTQAAMRLIPDAAALAEQIDRQGARLLAALRAAAAEARSRLQASAGRPMFRRPGELVAIHRAGLGSAQQHLSHLAAARLTESEVRLGRLEARLGRVRPDRLAARAERERAARLATMTERLRRVTLAQVERAGLALSSGERELAAVSPLAVLGRGYSVTFGPGGEAVRSAAGLAPGTRIETRLADGSVRSVVEGGEAAKPRPKPGPKQNPRPATKDEEADQMDLFDAGG
jgi:exodeoxyribonuclease VII large subunit